MWRGALLVALVAACATPATPGDGGSDAPPLACDHPDEVCPPAPAWPALGGPCVGDLRCPYARSDASMFDAVCVEGHWDIELTCTATGCLPPLVEECETPFPGSLAGATLEIGPPAEDRSYAPEERVPVVYGPQGAPMFPFAIRVRGLDAPPSCVAYTVEMAFDGGETRTSVPRSALLRCGGSRAVFWNPPDLLCAEVGVTVTLRVADLETTVHVISVDDAPSCL